LGFPHPLFWNVPSFGTSLAAAFFFSPFVIVPAGGQHFRIPVFFDDTSRQARLFFPPVGFLPVRRTFFDLPPAAWLFDRQGRYLFVFSFFATFFFSLYGVL